MALSVLRFNFEYFPLSFVHPTTLGLLLGKKAGLNIKTKLLKFMRFSRLENMSASEDSSTRPMQN
jgi:hypothetical protein